MAEDMDIDALLEQGNVSVITDWLHEHIHRFGAVYDARDLLMKVTEEDSLTRNITSNICRVVG